MSFWPSFAAWLGTFFDTADVMLVMAPEATAPVTAVFFAVSRGEVMGAPMPLLLPESN
jgi:hypothetical protein